MRIDRQIPFFFCEWIEIFLNSGTRLGFYFRSYIYIYIAYVLWDSLIYLLKYTIYAFNVVHLCSWNPSLFDLGVSMGGGRVNIVKANCLSLFISQQLHKDNRVENWERNTAIVKHVQAWFLFSNIHIKMCIIAVVSQGDMT